MFWLPSSTPGYLINTIFLFQFSWRFEVLRGQEANWDSQQPPSTNSIYDNTTSHPMEKWYNFRSIEVGSTVGVCRSLFGDVKANHNCWAARSRGEPKTGKPEPNRGDEIPISLGEKSNCWDEISSKMFKQISSCIVRIHTWAMEKTLVGWVIYGDYTTQLYRDYNKPL